MSARESIIPVFVPHLGCPHNCVFCNQTRISGQLEPATPQTVTDEIENAAAFLPKGGKRQLAFDGGSFTAIPAAEQDRVFERFYRVDKSHSRAIGGTGLGLSIVKHAAAYHHARVALESTLGTGTTVTVTFPRPGEA